MHVLHVYSLTAILDIRKWCVLIINKKKIINKKNMKKILFFLVIAGLVGGFLAPTALAYSDTKGKVLLQVEDKGQLWYITNDGKSKFYLGSPVDMFRLMRFQGVGISNSDLAKIPEAGKSQMSDE